MGGGSRRPTLASRRKLSGPLQSRIMGIDTLPFAASPTDKILSSSTKLPNVVVNAGDRVALFSGTDRRLCTKKRTRTLPTEALCERKPRLPVSFPLLQLSFPVCANPSPASEPTEAGKRSARTGKESFPPLVKPGARGSDSAGPIMMRMGGEGSLPHQRLSRGRGSNPSPSSNFSAAWGT